MTFSTTCGFRRNPGICIPEFWICFAVASGPGPIPVVSTQKMAKIAPPTTMKVRSMISRTAIIHGSTDAGISPRNHIQSVRA